MELQTIETPGQIVAAARNAVTPADLLRHAMDSGADLDRLEKLMDLQDRWEANEARKAFADGMAAFKKSPPTIYKDKHVGFKTDKGRTEYDHATIGNVNELVIAALAEHGFSHRWIPGQRDGQVIVTCVITHRLGHKEETTLQSSPDNTGGKNGIQSIISAQTYLQRHTLLAATGLATKDQEDDDGASVGTTDIRLADEWIGHAKVATTTGALEIVWNKGSAAFKSARDDHGLEEFTVACNERLAQLKAANQKPAANKSSRLNDIVGQRAPAAE